MIGSEAAGSSAARANATFCVEPKVKTVKGTETTRWELSYQSSDDDSPAVVIGYYASKSAAIRGRVTHPDRQGHGAVVDSDAPAWTPNELTVTPPAPGMVKVRWFDSVDTTQIYWEYAAELQPIDVT
ncbi:hypothetical protein KL864_33960 [Mycolicibacterium goodii]|uniref:hypothetical protein n=1 Tax=Mycolicibacterium goodii TaxID=134601 RepID=UPI001BDC9A95|nr:hypothetical protein [Mycolicibacterium goodii]MBU8820873.1 hypothetical protein [Mycolicibacterium goodii]